MHSVSANNNLAPFRLWLRENMLKLKKISRYFVTRCLENFLLLVISLRINLNLNINYEK